MNELESQNHQASFLIYKMRIIVLRLLHKKVMRSKQNDPKDFMNELAKASLHPQVVNPDGPRSYWRICG